MQRRIGGNAKERTEKKERIKSGKSKVNRKKCKGNEKKGMMENKNKYQKFLRWLLPAFALSISIKGS